MTGRLEDKSRVEDELAPAAAIESWLGGMMPGTGPIAVRRVTTGHSNELFELARGDTRWMLRRPPRVPNAPTAHDVAREYRVLRALDGSGVPHARPLLLCPDASIVGAPFLVTERIDGVALYDEIPQALNSSRREIAFALIDAMAALHAVDWEARGLGDFGRPIGYSERQADRWAGQLARYDARPLPDLAAVASWLQHECRGTSAGTVIHGDYGLHNVMFGRSLPIRALAIVDWETATIGDPLADLGYLLADWLDPGDDAMWRPLGPQCGMEGFPSRDEMLSRYCEARGAEISVPELRWYRALGQFKIAVILEGSYGRFCRGEANDPFFESLGERVPLLARHALAITRGEA
jgi:aminoglycoside phosphotransferase (APT) family kinase protein